MLYGVIDIGSNTIRLTIYEVDEQTNAFSTLFKLKTMAGLVSYIDKKSGMMDKAGMERLVDVLQSYLACAARFKELNGPHIFATAGVRNAKNAREVIERAEKACGLPIELLSGREEAELGYAGAMYQSMLTTGVQIDVGGGSAEVTTFDHGAISHVTSIPHGSLSLFGTFVHELLPTPAESDRIRALIRKHLTEVEGFKGFTCSVASGVGGSVRAASRLRDTWCPDERGPRANVTRDQVKAVLDFVAYDPHRASRDILRVAPERAHTCIPGLLVVETVMDAFGAAELEVHEFGVREGYLLAHVLHAVDPRQPRGKKKSQKV